jgi:hypothetical protein
MPEFKKNSFIAFSSKPSTAEAIKEISRKIKWGTSAKPKGPYIIILFFTPEYDPEVIQETLNITVRPKHFFATQAPAIIYQNTILKKGIAACYLDVTNFKLKQFLCTKDNAERIEADFRTNYMDLKGGEKITLSTITPKINPNLHLKTIKYGIGSNAQFFGCGFLKKYGMKNFQISNNNIGTGINNLMLNGKFDINYEKSSGFFPIGKPFTITKASPQKNLIMEIDNQPAINAYKQYFQENFSLLKKTMMINLYPLGLRQGGNWRTINILDILEDGSLFCLGNIREGDRVKIMMANPDSLIQETQEIAEKIKVQYKSDIVFIFGALSRQKILKHKMEQEIELIKNILGQGTKIIGCYCDYNFFPQKETHNFFIENNSLCIILLKYGNN